jgi:hypothetical protein
VNAEPISPNLSTNCLFFCEDFKGKKEKKLQKFNLPSWKKILRDFKITVFGNKHLETLLETTFFRLEEKKKCDENRGYAKKVFFFIFAFRTGLPDGLF